MLVAPSDHVVPDAPAFRAAVAAGTEAARAGQLVTFGIRPTHPETGYGYIRAGADGSVERFVEKPDAATAARYLADGGYFWNAGIFVLRASVWLAALERFRPDIASAVHAAWAVRSADNGFVRPGKSEFAAVPAESVDYAVMERCPGSAQPIRMLPLAAGWNDLGAWDAVWQVAPKDADGNATHGDALVVDSRGVLVHATSRLVGVVGLADVVVVETADAVLVADRARSQEVKKIVGRLGTQASDPV